MLRIEATDLVYSYDRRHPPAVVVNPGQRVAVVTHDRFTTESDFDQLWSTARSPIAAVTGPIAVAGARAGTTLIATIHDMELDPDSGAVFSIPGRGVWGEEISRPALERVRIEDSFCRLGDIAVPLRPHVGRLAVAPAEGTFPTATCGPYGGNLDVPDLGPGARLALPVGVDGAMVVIGDLHAAMGDGECNVSGIEAAGVVTLSFELQPEPVPRPLVITSGELMCVADGATLDEAARVAIDDLRRLVRSRLGLDDTAARHLLSAAADIRVCQVVNPRVSVRAVISRDILPWP